jgi:hypothetical protein
MAGICTSGGEGGDIGIMLLRGFNAEGVEGEWVRCWVGVCVFLLLPFVFDDGADFLVGGGGGASLKLCALRRLAFVFEDASAVL